MCLHIVFKKKLYIFKKSSIFSSKANFERSLLIYQLVRVGQHIPSHLGKSHTKQSAFAGKENIFLTHQAALLPKESASILSLS